VLSDHVQASSVPVRSASRLHVQHSKRGGGGGERTPFCTNSERDANIIVSDKLQHSSKGEGKPNSVKTRTSPCDDGDSDGDECGGGDRDDIMCMDGQNGNNTVDVVVEGGDKNIIDMYASCDGSYGYVCDVCGLLRTRDPCESSQNSASSIGNNNQKNSSKSNLAPYAGGNSSSKVSNNNNNSGNCTHSVSSSSSNSNQRSRHINNSGSGSGTPTGGDRGLNSGHGLNSEDNNGGNIGENSGSRCTCVHSNDAGGSGAHERGVKSPTDTNMSQRTTPTDRQQGKDDGVHGGKSNAHTLGKVCVCVCT
jgi:hypothetical protein